MEIDWIKVVDTLASEYGWTIEYIQTLDMTEVSRLVACINKRKITESKFLCYIINCAIAGKNPKLNSETTEEIKSIDNVEVLKKLMKTIGGKVEPLKKNKKG